MTSADHYFSASPNSTLHLQDITVSLAGHHHTLTTSNGIFSPQGIDQGTQILLDYLQDHINIPQEANLLDLGCGWGPIALTLAICKPSSTIWALDINTRAIELLTINAQALGLSNIRAVTPEMLPPDITFDALYSNPPIRIGKKALHDLLTTWFSRLSPQATAWMVVQRHLGSDSLQAWLNETFNHLQTTRQYSKKSFRILHTQSRTGQKF